jgi:hypothetical protein
MRSVLALALLITLCASANVATVHRSKLPEGHFRTHQRVAVRPGQRVTTPTRFAVQRQRRLWLGLIVDACPAECRRARLATETIAKNSNKFDRAIAESG